MEAVWGAIIGAITTIFVTIWRTKTKRKYAKKDRRTEEPEKLKFHRIHPKLYQLKMSVNHNIECEYRGKEKLVKDFLNNMLDIYIKMVDDISRKVDNEEMTDAELYQYNVKKLKEALDKRSNFFYTPEYSEDEQVAMAVFLELYEQFNGDHIEKFFDDIRYICYSKYYTNNVVRQSFIFERYIAEFVRVIIWASEKTAELNGEFDGLKYDGSLIVAEEH